MLLLSTALDCESFSALFSLLGDTDMVEACAELEYGLARCCHLNPKILILDPKIDQQSLVRVAALISRGRVENLLVLDDCIHEGLLVKLLRMPRTSYMTRRSGFSALLAAVKTIAEKSERVFDPEISDWVSRSPRGHRLMCRPNQPSIAALTPRELEVFQYVAQGFSVRACAEQMQLSESTIDNHKSRIMKKLQVHKASQLTHVAIREGVISV